MWTEPVTAETPASAAARTHAQSTILLRRRLDEALAGMQGSLRWSSAHALGDRVFTVAANDAGAGELLTRCLLPAERVAREAGSEPHLRIFVCAGSAPPFLRLPPWDLPHTDARHRERLHLSPDGRLTAFYDEARDFWMILDRDTRRALVWIAEVDRLPPWEAAAPFKQILQWSMVGTGLSMVHGGAVARAGHGVLLVGAGGSGKSTTVAACLQAGLETCGDDLIVVRRSARGWRAHALYDSIKLLPRAAIAAPPLLAGAPWRECGEKRVVRYSDVAIEPARRMPLRALLHCRITGRDTSALIPVTPAEMLRAIAPPTVFLLRGREAHLLGEMSALVRSLPCLRLELGENPSEAAAFLGQWLGDLPGERDDA